MMNTFVFLIMSTVATPNWSVTPMPSMSVCEQVKKEIESHTGESFRDRFSRAPTGIECKAFQDKQ